MRNFIIILLFSCNSPINVTRDYIFQNEQKHIYYIELAKHFKDSAELYKKYSDSAEYFYKLLYPDGNRK